MSAKTRQSRYEIPTGEIEDLMKKVERVSVRVSRRNNKGHLAHVWSGEMATQDLLTLDQFLMRLAGGGDYNVIVRDARNITVNLVDTFNCVVEGPSRPPLFAGSQPEQVMPAGAPAAHPSATPFAGGLPSASFAAPSMEGDPGMSNPYQPPLPPWAMGLDPYARSGYEAYRAMRYPQRVATGPTVASDELAMKQAAELKAQNAKLEEKLEGFMQRYESDVGRLRDENAAYRAQLAQSKQEAEMAALRAKLEAMTAAPRETGPKFDIAAIGGVLAALAPVLQAMITSGAEKQSLALRAQQEGMQQLMQATLQQANKDSGIKELATTFGPLLLPLVQQMFSQKDPEKQAALYEAMATNNLNSIAMMAQLLESISASQGPQPPWYFDAIQQALAGIVQVAERYVQTPGGLPGQPKPRLEAPRPTGVVEVAKQVQSAPAAAPVRQTYDDDINTARQVSGRAQTLLPFLPAEFRQNGWEVFLRHLHEEPQWSPDWIGNGLAELILESVEQNTLPKQLQPMLAEGADYKAILLSLVERLPIAVDAPHYAEAVVDVAVAALIEAVHADEAEDEQEPPRVIDAAPAKSAVQEVTEAALAHSAPLEYAKASSVG